MKKRRIIPLVFSMVLLGGAGVAVVSLSGCTGGGGGDLHAKEMYNQYCSPCHGEKGDGNGHNAKFVDPPPADHTSPDMAGKSNDKLFQMIKVGGKGAARSAKMPPFGNVLSEKEIWQLVAYMRTLHPNSEPAVNLEGKDDKRPSFTQPASVKLNFPVIPGVTAPAVSAPAGDALAGAEAGAATTPDPAAESALAAANEEWQGLVKDGKKLYKRVGCPACHRIGEDGGRIGPELSRVGARLRPEWMFKWLKSPQSIYPKTKMPNFGLSDEDAKALVAYLVDQKAEKAGSGSLGNPYLIQEAAKEGAGETETKEGTEG